VPDEPDRFRGCLLGLAVGDAVGTALEFTTPGSFEPITDMVGGGPFRLEPGQWTDDTSMALCLATSLVRQGGFDARDQMQRYCDWVETGSWSSTGRCFDIGNTVAMSLEEFGTSGNPFAGPTGERTAGNGSLMRLAPVVLFFYPDREDVIKFAAESSRTTHGAPECLDACRIMSEFLLRALSAASQQEILTAVRGNFCSPALQSIAELDFQGKLRSQIRGTGYVVHCLEAAMWCFEQTTSFREAILLAANLGEDADTTAAVCGQVAGAHYGAGGIPDAWLTRLTMGDQIAALADQLREKT